MPKRENRKSINFDLDTRRLIAEFGEKRRRQAYSQVQRFLERNGFEHKQWSGYISISKMSYLETYVLIDRLITACPWLSYCTNSFHVTDFMAESDAIGYITADRSAMGIMPTGGLDISS